ncbi:MAG: long-chain fatty acid--CoA ligase [Spirobacillus cienkowskii]|jgi:long-chain acyl-CoA synthetase|uniref:Long-chain-fatty-acid--CoA ligase n=1 Tax=Spirobacillus cienkowskii TaxID=495820 RepID=A0A369KQY8_9BACT|nr:MAG: long-chain fatty acid--CoA ligase [Spirobacillus cienkowskii]
MTGWNIECKERPWQSHYGEGTNLEIPAFEFSNLADMITKTSVKWNSKTACSLVLPNGIEGAFSYSEINLLSDAFAVYLREVLDIQKGDRIAIQMPNCLSYPLAVFGCFKAGAVVVNTNPLYTTFEMEHQFKDSGAKVLIIMDLFADKLKDVIPNTDIKKVILVSIADFLPFFKKNLVKLVLKYVKKQVPKCEVYFEPLPNAIDQGLKILNAKNIAVKNYWQSVTLDDLCALQYTGGTTGVSKGAMLTHRNLMANVYQILEMGKSKIVFGDEVILSVLPLYHIFAFTVNLLSFYYCGAESVLIPNPRPLTNLQKAIARKKISWTSGVNTLFNGLLNEKWFYENPPQYLKCSIAGGASLHHAVAERWEKITKTSVVEGFGLTEASPVVSFNPINGVVKIDTVGLPVPSTDVVLLDDNGEVVPLGEQGEIAVRGPQVMKGYWQRPEETTKCFKGNWLLTGDVGVMDRDGYIKIVDRKKDLILVSGFNVYPNEVEDCIAKIAGVAEVAVVGVPNSKTGEAVKAVIVKKDPALTESEVIEHCQKFITQYKVPKVIEFKTELPKTSIGKVLRKNLRQES